MNDNRMNDHSRMYGTIEGEMMMHALWKKICGMVMGLAGLVLMVLLMVPVDSQAMPSFARQTGMNCNSCHIGTDNVPNFTRTGRIFAMRGYTRTEVREKLRAEGDTIEDMPQYGGDYLALNWNDYFSARFISSLVAQSETAAGVKSAVTSRPLGRMAMFYTGPITDWVGLWTEIGYLGNNQLNSVTTGRTGPTGLNLFGYDEYRLSTGMDLAPGTFIGMSLGNELPNVVSQWVFPAGLPSQWNNGQGGTGRFKEIAAYSFHGLFDDRYWAQIGFVTGMDNISWSDGSNVYTAWGYNLFRETRNDMWFVLETYHGKDMPTQMTSIRDSYICPGTCPAGVTDSTLSISNNRGGGVVLNAPFVRIKNFTSYKLRWESSVADRGSHSWIASAVYHPMKENLVGGGSVERDLFGVYLRYFYKRTYGFQAQWQTQLKYDFTNAAGLTRGVYTRPAMSVTGLWNPAMNFSVNFNYNPRVQNRVFEDQRNLYTSGTSRSIGIEYNF